MSYIKGILKEEYERFNALSRKYRDKVGELPKGCVSIKKTEEGCTICIWHPAKAGKSVSSI